VAEIAAIQHKLPCEVIDAVTWPDYIGLQKFWAEWPPLIISSAVLAGMSPQQRKKAGADGEPTDDQVAEQVCALEGLIGRPAPATEEA
jgi:hypothetical protein